MRKKASKDVSEFICPICERVKCICEDTDYEQSQYFKREKEIEESNKSTINAMPLEEIAVCIKSLNDFRIEAYKHHESTRAWLDGSRFDKLKELDKSVENINSCLDGYIVVWNSHYHSYSLIPVLPDEEESEKQV